MFSRGTGEKGQDISGLIPYVFNKNMKFDEMPNGMAVRGELLMSKKDFQQLQKDHDLKNSRNVVSGLVNCKDIDKRIHIARKTVFIAHSMVNPLFLAYEQIDKLKQYGFHVVDNIVQKHITNEFLSDLLIKTRSQSLYECDGIVIVDSSTTYKNSLDIPDHAFAFKFALSDEVFETNVIDVLWTESMHGYLKPTIHLNTVKTKDVEIQYVTGNNAKFIFENKIGPGAVVQIIRSGDVIPKITNVLKPADEPKCHPSNTNGIKHMSIY